MLMWIKINCKKKTVFQTILAEWHWSSVDWKHLKPVIFRWIIATAFIFLFTWRFENENLFYIPRHAPEIIPVLLIFYTVLSALPQEFIFCSFFMSRYGKYFNHPHLKITASALVFAYAHVLFLNWIAPVFSFIGGLIFAYTYMKTRSLALVTIEHGLYGNSIFIIGLGYYFYSGDTEIISSRNL